MASRAERVRGPRGVVMATGYCARVVHLMARTSKDRLPGPRGNPLLGSTLSLKNDLLRTLLRDRERYGDLVAYPVGPVGPLRQQFVVVHHPDDVQKVLAHTERTLSK